MSRNRKSSMPITATISGVAAMLLAQSALAADGVTLPIKKISADGSQQLVIEFGGGGFPTVPQVLDLPGPNHRVVIDFADASLDKSAVLGAEELSGAVKQSIPFVKAVRYSNLENSTKPTARVVVDLPEEVKVKPRVVKLEEGMVVVGFSDQPINVTATPEQPAATTAASGSGAWDWSGQTAGGAATSTPATPATPVATTPATPVTPAATTAAEPARAAETPVAATPAADESAGLRPAMPASTTASAAAVDNAPPTEAAAAPSEPATPVATETPTSTPVTSVSTPATDGGATSFSSRSSSGTALGAPPEGTASAPETAAVPKSEGSRTEAVKKYNKAVQLHLAGKLEEAIAAYKEALEVNNSLAEAHSNLGLIFNQQHNYGQALAEFRKALAVNPKDAITYNGIGAALRAEKDLPGAIKNWQTAVSLDGKLATAHYNLGTAYEIQKEYDKALGSYKAAVKNDYRLGEAYYRMGLIMERKHRMEEAAEQFKEALRVSGDSEYSEDARQRLVFLEKSKTSKQ